jgi:hypothetical protein
VVLSLLRGKNIIESHLHCPLLLNLAEAGMFWELIPYLIYCVPRRDQKEAVLEWEQRLRLPQRAQAFDSWDLLQMLNTQHLSAQ